MTNSPLFRNPAAQPGLRRRGEQSRLGKPLEQFPTQNPLRQ
jgi:hypothetical protein